MYFTVVSLLLSRYM